MLGVVAGLTVAAILIEKGREIMEQTMVLERNQGFDRVKTPEEQLLDKRLFNAILKSNPQFVELNADAEGNVIVDKEKHPDLYDWVVNG